MTRYKEHLQRYSEQIKDKLKAKNVPVVISTSQIEKMLIISDRCDEKESETIAFLILVIPVYFGVNIENLTSSIYNLTYEALIDRFIGITLTDLDNAFKSTEINKKEYVSLTREELLKPIKEYWSKKMAVISELKSIDNDFEEQKLKDEQIKVFNGTVKEKYFEALKTGVWNGDYFESLSIVKIYSSYINDEERKILWKKSLEEHQKFLNISFTPVIGENVTNIHNKPLYFGSREKVYAVIFMQKIIDKKIKWIQE